MIGLPVCQCGFSPIFDKTFMRSEFSWALLGIGSFAFRDRHFASAVLYVLSPIEFTQYFFPPMDASTAAFSVHLSTGLTAGKTFVSGFFVGFVVGFLVVVVDVRVDVVVVDCNLVVEDVAKIRLIRFAIFFYF